MQYSLLLILSLLAILLIIPVPASAQTLAEEDWKTAQVRVVTSPSDAHDATIRYKLSSGEIGFIYTDANGTRQIQRDVIQAYPQFQSLSINVINGAYGTLVLELPRNVIDAKMSDNVADAPLTAFFHQDTSIIPAAVQELNKTEDLRVVAIDFPVLESDSAYNISIQGTYVIPEFGAVAPIALGLALTGVLSLATRFRLFR